VREAEHPGAVEVPGRSVVLAVLAGLGFGTFFTGISSAATHDPFWAAVASRGGGSAVVVIAALAVSAPLVVSRAVLPPLLAIAVIAILGPGLNNTMAAIGVALTPVYARTVRAASLQVSDSEYVRAATVIGVPRRRILIRHVLRNVWTPITVISTVNVTVPGTWDVWTGNGGDGEWNNGDNWSLGLAPRPTDVAYVDSTHDDIGPVITDNLAAGGSDQSVAQLHVLNGTILDIVAAPAGAETSDSLPARVKAVGVPPFWFVSVLSCVSMMPSKRTRAAQ